MGRLILGLAVAGACTGTTALASPSFIVRSDESIGTFAVKKDGTLGGLQAAFGEPTRLTPTQDGCVGLWGPSGMRVSFYNLAGKNPCRPKTGFFSDALLTGKEWRTAKGLRIGDPLARFQQLYPKAERHRDWRWLVIRFTQATGRYAGLQARVAGGRVTALRVTYGAGGE